jgi:uncharacterized repeat protein (TIGR03837 family)
MQWHLYCRVVDNFGDIGVAWRLAADLAGRGHSVRLAVDDASALAWLAPEGAAGVEVVGWADGGAPPADAVVEMFGAGLPESARATASAQARSAVFVNLEHLSAEAYVERSHGLPSPHRLADGSAAMTWFFYPGFGARTGGLLREPGLLDRRRAFTGNAHAFARNGIETRADERCVSLFCYRNEAIAPLLDALAEAPTYLLLAPSPASDQVASLLGPSLARGALRATRLPYLTQADFDRLLWSCDLNFVRGEDSLVRAIWAGAPFVWQAYPQDDGAHHAKLAAFLDRYLAGAAPALAAGLRSVFTRWNGMTSGALDLPAAAGALATEWAHHSAGWRDALASQPDLVTQLIGWVASKR